MGHSLDRRFSVDDTFAQVADALEASKFLSIPKGIEDLRIKALRSLIGVADRQFFESKLAFALDEETIPPLATDISAVVERGLQVLADGQTPAFDLASACRSGRRPGADGRGGSRAPWLPDRRRATFGPNPCPPVRSAGQGSGRGKLEVR